MNRFWAGLPIAVMAAVPLWTETSAAVIVIETVAILLCVIGVLRDLLVAVTTGAVYATIGYAVALWLENTGVNVVGAAVFGLALLFLLDLSEFGRRFHGAQVATDIVQTQVWYWLGRAALIIGAVLSLTLAGTVLGMLVPGAGRAIAAGLGVVIAFAGALYAGIYRAEPR